jgi:hypothetical protein
VSDEEKLSAANDWLTAFVDQRIEAALIEHCAAMTREIIGIAAIFAKLKQGFVEWDAKLERLQKMLLANRPAPDDARTEIGLAGTDSSKSFPM